MYNYNLDCYDIIVLPVLPIYPFLKDKSAKAYDRNNLRIYDIH